MLIKDQIRARLDALGMTMQELANRVGVTETAVRHWTSGRSYPNKRKAKEIEAALSFSIDWHEGSDYTGAPTTAANMIDARDIELLLQLGRLPFGFKSSIVELISAHLAVLDRVNKTTVTLPLAPSPTAKPVAKKATKA